MAKKSIDEENREMQRKSDTYKQTEKRKEESKKSAAKATIANSSMTQSESSKKLSKSYTGETTSFQDLQKYFSDLSKTTTSKNDLKNYSNNVKDVYSNYQKKKEEEKQQRAADPNSNKAVKAIASWFNKENNTYEPDEETQKKENEIFSGDTRNVRTDNADFIKEQAAEKGMTEYDYVKQAKKNANNRKESEQIISDSLKNAANKEEDLIEVKLSNGTSTTLKDYNEKINNYNSSFNSLNAEKEQLEEIYERRGSLTEAQLNRYNSIISEINNLIEGAKDYDAIDAGWTDYDAKGKEIDAAIKEKKAQLSVAQENNDIAAIATLTEELSQLETDKSANKEKKSDQEAYIISQNYDYVMNNGTAQEKEKYAEYVASRNDNLLQRLANMGTASVIGMVGSVFNYADLVLERIDEYNGKNDFDPNNPNLISNQLAAAKNRLNEFSLNGTEGTGRFVLQSVQSLMPFVTTILTAKAMGVKEGINAVSTIAQGLQVGAETAKQDLANGIDLPTAELHGTIMGAISTLTEAIGGEGFVNMISGNAVAGLIGDGVLQSVNWLDVVRIINQSSLSEGVEEIMEDVLDRAGNYIVNNVGGTDFEDFNSLNSAEGLANYAGDLATSFAMAYVGSVILGVLKTTPAAVHNNAYYNYITGDMAIQNQAQFDSAQHIKELLTQGIELNNQEIEQLKLKENSQEEIANKTSDSNAAYRAINAIDALMRRYSENSLTKDRVILLNDKSNIPTVEQSYGALIEGLRNDITETIDITNELAINTAIANKLTEQVLNERNIKVSTNEWSSYDDEAQSTISYIARSWQKMGIKDFAIENLGDDDMGMNITVNGKNVIKINANGNAVDIFTGKELSTAETIKRVAIHELWHRIENTEAGKQLKSLLDNEKFSKTMSYITSELNKNDISDIDIEKYAYMLENTLDSEAFIDQLVARDGNSFKQFVGNLKAMFGSAKLQYFNAVLNKYEAALKEYENIPENEKFILNAELKSQKLSINDINELKTKVIEYSKTTDNYNSIFNEALRLYENTDKGTIITNVFKKLVSRLDDGMPDAKEYDFFNETLALNDNVNDLEKKYRNLQIEEANLFNSGADLSNSLEMHKINYKKTQIGKKLERLRKEESLRNRDTTVVDEKPLTFDQKVILNDIYEISFKLSTYGYYIDAKNKSGGTVKNGSYTKENLSDTFGTTVANEIISKADTKSQTTNNIPKDTTIYSDENNIKNVVKMAKKEYGITTNPNVVGYMLPDGKYLNFGNPDVNDNMRYTDHREAPYAMEFMKFGNIRMFPESAGFELIMKPNLKQQKSLLKYLSTVNSPYGHFIGISNTENIGRNDIASLVFENGETPKQIMEKVMSYFPEEVKYSKRLENALSKNEWAYLYKNYKEFANSKGEGQNVLLSEQNDAKTKIANFYIEEFELQDLENVYLIDNKDLPTVRNSLNIIKQEHIDEGAHYIFTEISEYFKGLQRDGTLLPYNPRSKSFANYWKSNGENNGSIRGNISLQYEPQADISGASELHTGESKDSNGRELTSKVIKYFKYSKVVDENGRLKVMYTGSPNDFTVFDKKKARKSGLYGAGFYFTESKSAASTYGNVMEVYLNITNPVDVNNETRTITDDQLRKYVTELAENEDYGIENYGYGATVDSIVKNLKGKSDFALLQDLNATCVGDMVEAVELFNKINGTNYDGIVAKTETVAFYPNQIKNTDNLNPTYNDDIRYSKKLDADYHKAVEDNDIETAQKLVDEAARENGYKVENYYHGSPKRFTVFSHDKTGGLFYVTDDKQAADNYSYDSGGGREADTNILLNYDNEVWYEYDEEAKLYIPMGTYYYDESNNEKLVEGFDKPNIYGEYVSEPDPLTRDQGWMVVYEYNGSFTTNGRTLYKLYVKANNTLDLENDSKAARNVFIKMVVDLEKEGIDSKARERIVRIIDKLNHYSEDVWMETKNEYYEKVWDKWIVPYLKKLGYDSISYKDDIHDTLAVFDSNQLKSAEPITYDDEGNVIPLSERFNDKNEDIRWAKKLKKNVELTEAQNNIKQEMFKLGIEDAMSDNLVRYVEKQITSYNETGNKEIINDLKDYLQSRVGIEYDMGKEGYDFSAKDLRKTMKNTTLDWGSLKKDLPASSKEQQKWRKAMEKYYTIRNTGGVSADVLLQMVNDDFDIDITSNGRYALEELADIYDDVNTRNNTVNYSGMPGLYMYGITEEQWNDNFNNLVKNVSNNITEDIKKSIDFIDGLKESDKGKKTALEKDFDKAEITRQSFIENADKWLPNYEVIAEKYNNFSNETLNDALYQILVEGTISQETRNQLIQEMIENDFEGLYQQADIAEEIKDFCDDAVSFFAADEALQREDGKQIKKTATVATKFNRQYSEVGTDAEERYKKAEKNVELNEDKKQVKRTFAEVYEEVAHTVATMAANKDIGKLSYMTVDQVHDVICGGNTELRKEIYNTVEKRIREAHDTYVQTAERYNDVIQEIVSDNGLGIRGGSKESKLLQYYIEKHTEIRASGENVKSYYGYQAYTEADLKRDADYKMKNGKTAYENIIAAANILRPVLDDMWKELTIVQTTIYGDVVGDAEIKLAELGGKVKELVYAVEDLKKQFKAAPTPQLQAMLQREQTRLRNAVNSYNTAVDKHASKDDIRRHLTPYRSNYMHHIQKNDFINKLKTAWNGVNTTPTAFTGIENQISPNSAWGSFMAAQEGGEYIPDAVNSFANYITEYSRVFAFDPMINELREYQNKVRDYSQNIANNGYVEYLDEWLNDIAGKRDIFDKGVQARLSTRALNMIRLLVNQSKGAVLSFNPRSAIVQIANIPNGIGVLQMNSDAKTAYSNLGKGVAAFITKDSSARQAMQNSIFLNERYFDVETKDVSKKAKVKAVSNWMLTAGDKFGSEIIWLSAYNQGIEQNVEDAVRYADDLTRRSVAGRGIGEVPPALKSTVFNLLIPFQVETNNQWQTFKRQVSNKQYGATVSTMAAAYLLNSLFSFIGAGDALPEFITPIIEEIKKYRKDKDDDGNTLGSLLLNITAGEIAELASMIPGGSNIIGLALSDDDAESIFGDYSPSRYGTTKLGFKGLGDIATDAYKSGASLAKGDYSGALKNAAAVGKDVVKNYVPAGTQIVRTTEGLQSMGALPQITPNGVEITPVNYTDKGKIRYINDQTNIGDWLKATMFGKWNTSAAQDYIEGGFKSVNVTTERIMNAISDSVGSQTEALKIAQSISDINGIKGVKNSQALAVRYELEQQGLYDEVINAINTQGLDPGKFNLNKVVVGYDSSKFNEEYNKVYGSGAKTEAKTDNKTTKTSSVSTTNNKAATSAKKTGYTNTNMSKKTSTASSKNSLTKTEQSIYEAISAATKKISGNSKNVNTTIANIMSKVNKSGASTKSNIAAMQKKLKNL